MADPLSFTSSIVGVTVPALHGIRLLLDDVRRIKDAPSAVQSLKKDISSTDTALKSLQAVKEEEWRLLGEDMADRSKAVITTCVTACETFRTDLQRWNRTFWRWKTLMARSGQCGILQRRSSQVHVRPASKLQNHHHLSSQHGDSVSDHQSTEGVAEVLIFAF
jgi:hypothetical protein